MSKDMHSREVALAIALLDAARKVEELVAAKEPSYTGRFWPAKVAEWRKLAAALAPGPIRVRKTPQDATSPRG